MWPLQLNHPLSSQCCPVRWSTVGPGLEVRKRHAVNSTPNIHFPVLQVELFLEKSESFVNSFHLLILTFFLSTILPQLFAFSSISPGLPEYYWWKSRFLYLPGDGDWFHRRKVRVSLTQSCFSEHPASQVLYKGETNWATSSKVFVFAFYKSLGQHFWHKYAKSRYKKEFPDSFCMCSFLQKE